MKFLDWWRTISAVRLAIGLMVLFLGLFVGLFAYFVAEGADQQRQRFEERATYGAKVVAANTFWISEVANQTLRRVDATLGPFVNSRASEIELLLQDLPTGTEIYVIDSDADLLYATVPNYTDVSVADREYFQAVRDGASFYTSSLIVSRLTGEKVFVFSKRIDRGGRFAGAIMLSFPETSLGEIAETLGLEEGSTVSLIRGDGKLMARYPSADVAVDLSGQPLFTQYLPTSAEGTYTSAASPVDGIPRVVAYRRVPETDIIALASVATTGGWTTFKNAILTVLLIASPVVLAVILGFWWIVHLLRRDAERRKELQASVDLNTMLFREIHHRVKNNLQSVQALVRLQDIPDTAKRDLQSRFAAMAAMHEHIYMLDRYEDIDAHDFIPAVVEEVLKAYGSHAKLEFAVEHLSVDRDHATPLALLLSELVTNALKYAFPNGEGVVEITLAAREDGLADLVVRDNGVGMVDLAPSKSMGMRLISGVVAQMGGTYQFRSDAGLVFEATIALSVKVRQAS